MEQVIWGSVKTGKWDEKFFRQRSLTKFVTPKPDCLDRDPGISFLALNNRNLPNCLDRD